MWFIVSLFINLIRIFMKRLFCLFLLLFTVLASIDTLKASVAPPKEKQAFFTSQQSKNIIAYASKHLPQKGVLVAQPDGYVYLKVDDAYIHDLFPKLNLSQKGYHKPPYFRSYNSPGAHISVIYADERVHPKEVGKTIFFKLKDVVIVYPTKEISYAILEVESKSLEKLRTKYGLGPKLHGNEFHISIAKKEMAH